MVVAAIKAEWRNPMQHRPEWDRRIERILPYLPKPLVSVLDLGAYRCTLEQFLPDSVRYTPVDCLRRKHPNFVLADLNNAMLPPIPPHQVCVILGLLEYIENVPRLAHWVAQRCDVIVLTYAFRPPYQYAHNKDGFEQIWPSVGFRMTGYQTSAAYDIYRFERTRP